MSGTYKDKHKSEKPIVLKNEHKAHRQFARNVINYVQTEQNIEDQEVVDAQWAAADQEEKQAWEEYQASLKQSDFKED